MDRLIRFDFSTYLINLYSLPLVDFIRDNNWFKQNLFICLFASLIYFVVYWYYQYEPLLIPASIFCLLTIVSIWFYYKKKQELSFYIIYFNFFLVLPIFSAVIVVNFSIITAYSALLMNAFLMVLDKKALILISIAALLSFVVFVILHLFYINESILSIKSLDFVLSFIILLSMINTLLQFNEERALRIQELDNKKSELIKYIESNLELENFAFIASHDLKTPLRNIMSFSQLLRSKANDRLKPNEQGYLDMIIKSTQNMNQLVSDILKYSKSDSLEYQIEKVEIYPMINHVITELSDLIVEKNPIINLNINKGIFVKGDRSMLMSAFQNLITNAINYVAEGQIAKVNIYSENIKGNLVISVEDNGIGISSEYRQTIFLLFKRLHNQTTYNGTGIGLAIVKKIVEKHLGDIWVESNPKGGSIFKLSFPTNTN